MKNITFCLFTIGLIFLVNSCKKEESKTTPTEITIGSQTWMTKNLDASKFSNGDIIPEAKSDAEWQAAADNKSPVWCYYGNISSNNEKHGKLYNWYAVSDPRGLAPAGWHIATKDDFTNTINHLGGQNPAGSKLKSNSDWKDNGNGTNESGFNGFPSGARDFNGLFANSGVYGYWWTLSERSQTEVYFFLLSYSGSSASFLSTKKEDGLSIRCVKN